MLGFPAQSRIQDLVDEAFRPPPSYILSKPRKPMLLASGCAWLRWWWRLDPCVVLKPSARTADTLGPMNGWVVRSQHPLLVLSSSAITRSPSGATPRSFAVVLVNSLQGSASPSLRFCSAWHMTVGQKLPGHGWGCA